MDLAVGGGPPALLLMIGLFLWSRMRERVAALESEVKHLATQLVEVKVTQKDTDTDIKGIYDKISGMASDLSRIRGALDALAGKA